eukprot:765328-Hanusia_phi.AAC.4
MVMDATSLDVSQNDCQENAAAHARTGIDCSQANPILPSSRDAMTLAVMVLTCRPVSAVGLVAPHIQRERMLLVRRRVLLGE